MKEEENNEVENNEKEKKFIDPATITVTSMTLWFLQMAGGAIIYTIFAFFTKIGLTKLWKMFKKIWVKDKKDDSNKEPIES